MKNSIIAAVFSLLTLIVFSDFNFFKTIVWMPNFLWILPLYLFSRLSVFYFISVFTVKYKVVVKIGMIVLNILLAFFLLKTGFQIFKINNGNILMSEMASFQINIKNIWFWIIFQSYLLLFLFSGFKLLVTIDQK